MIPKYIENWLTIIDTMDNQNTYKLAWGRSLVEYVSLHELNGDYMNVDLYECAEIVLKYYWNQIFFFNLKQVPGDGKAIIIDEVNKLIKLYKEKSQSSQPKWFKDGYAVIGNTKEYKESLKLIKRILKENPVRYFLNASVSGTNKKTSLDIYEKHNDFVTIKSDNVKLIKEYSIVLAKLLNYKWTQLLEKYNYVPNLINKVTSISNGEIRRNSLEKYKKQLLKQFEDGNIIDFYTGEKLTINEISVDHVLPWSFIYSDDIWNLVITSKSNNSSKNNAIPKEDIIESLKIRNQMLLNIVDEEYKKSILEEIENKYIDKYYYEFKVSH